MKHNTQHNFKRTSRIVKCLVAGLLLASMAITANPAAANGGTNGQPTATATTAGANNGPSTTNVAWGGCGGNCGQ